tara:strand:+ start:6082 stop:6504 length:423 start_codon:yes stop_codon:yes gene_type:complete
MQLTQEAVDKIAISLSIICAVHCLFFPAILILISTFMSVELNNELIHLWILLIIIPFSIIGLTNGLRNHKNREFFLMGICGIVILGLAILIGAETLTEYGEKTLTLIGSIFIATAHFKNYQLCKHLNCHCHDIFQDNRTK